MDHTKIALSLNSSSVRVSMLKELSMSNTYISRQSYRPESDNLCIQSSTLGVYILKSLVFVADSKLPYKSLVLDVFSLFGDFVDTITL